MTPVERVARAICAAEVKRLGYAGDPAFFVEGFWRDHEPAARAAIEALREPSEGMEEAAMPVLSQYPDEGRPRAIWEAMISQALSETDQ